MNVGRVSFGPLRPRALEDFVAQRANRVRVADVRTLDETPHEGAPAAGPMQAVDERRDPTSATAVDLDLIGQAHQGRVAAVGVDFYHVCACGWSSNAHVSAWNAAVDVCTVAAAERERAHRARRNESRLSHATYFDRIGAGPASANHGEQRGNQP